MVEEEPREEGAAPDLGYAVPMEHAALFNKHVGAEIALWRRVLDMGQDEFAAMVGIERSRLSKIENGKLAARMDEFLAVAALVDTNVVDLLQPAYHRYHGQISTKSGPALPGA
ncbi:transcriptional regulator, XRE family [Segniliparus rotundus DSM 44985]|uniref:Transcriptional regulator, XRE family n=1 Tax=Segniliparus rotundus (strain ATCC BAA-972 / CDC 1076 / CIP 108378 / DSM 44985 / JCM 13578) TaxID=640132 RepID=D6Z9F0_SEGRD|nr:helix-turn-helix transcriptional regulator [Segniliparus rotundus]ADG98580.1 transcriptional regulator, XRE family [Segniliparus rotundus DSM 44985]